MKNFKWLCLILFFIYPYIFTASNAQNIFFIHSKHILCEKVYVNNIDRITLYCQAAFDIEGNITLPKGFTTKKYANRATRLEWEHVVPAENFGQTFTAWRDGDVLCVDRHGKAYKGRRCASKVSAEFRIMEADMYNIYPAIGAVNALRSNYNFAPMPKEANSFGMCPMKVHDRKADPPSYARGKIARAYLYMESTYARYSMSISQRKLMQAWNRQYPVTLDECRRTKRIEALQGNENKVVKEACINDKIW